MMKHLKIYEEYNNDEFNEDVVRLFPHHSEEIIEIVDSVNVEDPNSVDNALEKISFILHHPHDGFGVEAIHDEWWDKFYGDIVLLYVNMGDTYDPTIMFDPKEGEFIAGSWGDWVENNNIN